MEKIYTLAEGLLNEKYSMKDEGKCEEKKEKKTIASKVQKDEKKEDVEGESGESGSSVPEVEVEKIIKIIKIAKKLVDLGKKKEDAILEKAAKTILELCGEEIEEDED